MKIYLSELFSSVQGEGPYVGERHLFVRFCGCHRACIFCDTVVDRSETCQVERVAGTGEFDAVRNPLGVEALMALVRSIDAGKDNRRIALTGGEPLLQAMFLRELLPQLSEEGYSIYLETAGDLSRELKTIIEWIDVVAMDVKLASVTGEPNTLPAHAEFLTVCRDWDVDVFVKIVVSANTDEDELMQAVQIIKKTGGDATVVVLQPMSPARRMKAVPSAAQLLHWQAMISRQLPEVRVIPQMHKRMEML